MPCLAKVTDGKDRPLTVGVKLARGSGRQTVNWRDAKGIRRDAIVIAKGTTSGLRLFIVGQDRIVDNVPAMTAIKGVNVYDARH